MFDPLIVVIARADIERKTSSRRYPFCDACLSLPRRSSRVASGWT